MASIDQRKGTEREIIEMWSIIVRSKRRLDVNSVEEEEHTPVVILSKVTLQLDHIRKEVGQYIFDAADEHIRKRSSY